MDNKILFIGLDVDDKNYHAYAIIENETVGLNFRSKPHIHQMIKLIKEKLNGNYTFHFCYESTYSGYFLYREITKAGHECTIIAASLIPEKAEFICEWVSIQLLKSDSLRGLIMR